MSDATPWLFVGLGNPGPKYAANRHNIGFMVADRCLDRFGTPGASGWREKFHGEFASVDIASQRCYLLKPMTYMNRSGQSVAAASSFFRVSPKRTIVVHDELDFDFGRVAIKKGGGHGGHNGLRDIITAIGSREFVRVRTGIGRPPKGNVEVADWVLTNFRSEDAAELPDVVDRASGAAAAVVADGVAAAMNQFNQTAPKEATTPQPAES